LVKDVASVLLKVVAVIALILLAVAIVVVGVIFILSIIDPVPGDEVAVGAVEMFLINLMRSVGGFVFASAGAAGRPAFGVNGRGDDDAGSITDGGREEAFA
jgi:hypothetical protein